MGKLDRIPVAIYAAYLERGDGSPRLFAIRTATCSIPKQPQPVAITQAGTACGSALGGTARRCGYRAALGAGEHEVISPRDPERARAKAAELADVRARQPGGGNSNGEGGRRRTCLLPAGHGAAENATRLPTSVCGKIVVSTWPAPWGEPSQPPPRAPRPREGRRHGTTRPRGGLVLTRGHELAAGITRSSATYGAGGATPRPRLVNELGASMGCGGDWVGRGPRGPASRALTRCARSTPLKAENSGIKITGCRRGSTWPTPPSRRRPAPPHHRSVLEALGCRRRTRPSRDLCPHRSCGVGLSRHRHAAEVLGVDEGPLHPDARRDQWRGTIGHRAVDGQGPRSHDSLLDMERP